MTKPVFKSKVIEGHLVVNWKNGQMRIMKRKPKHLSPNQIPIHIKLKVNIPELKQAQATGEITVSETRATEMVIDEI